MNVSIVFVDICFLASTMKIHIWLFRQTKPFGNPNMSGSKDVVPSSTPSIRRTKYVYPLLFLYPSEGVKMLYHLISIHQRKWGCCTLLLLLLQSLEGVKMLYHLISIHQRKWGCCTLLLLLQSLEGVKMLCSSSHPLEEMRLVCPFSHPLEEIRLLCPFSHPLEGVRMLYSNLPYPSEGVIMVCPPLSSIRVSENVVSPSHIHQREWECCVPLSHPSEGVRMLGPSLPCPSDGVRMLCPPLSIHQREWEYLSRSPPSIRGNEHVLSPIFIFQFDK